MVFAAAHAGHRHLGAFRFHRGEGPGRALSSATTMTRAGYSPSSTAESIFNT